MKLPLADLHTHSTFSDGADSPTELVRMAAAQQVATLAITDHESIGGVLSAVGEAARLGIRLIPGVELAAASTEGVVHILGYYVNPADKNLCLRLRMIRETRLVRNEQLAARLAQAGWEISLEAVSAMASLSPDQLGTRHFTRAVTARLGVEKETALLMVRQIESELRREKLPLAECIALIHAAGGVAVLAHPRTIGPSWRRVLSIAISAGAVGIESIHPTHSNSDIETFRRAARDANLVSTGGSDYHGARRANRQLGQPRHEPELSANVADTLEELRP